MSTVFYTKEVSKNGKVTYRPAREYCHELSYALPEGAHLIVVRPGVTSTKYNIDPALAPMVAAGVYAIDSLCEQILKASELKIEQEPLTSEQVEAWDQLKKAYGPKCRLYWPSARQAAEEVVKFLELETAKLLSLPTVKTSYEKFQLVCKLAQNLSGEN